MDDVKGSAIENLQMSKTVQRWTRGFMFYIAMRCLLDILKVVAPTKFQGKSVNLTTAFDANGTMEEELHFIHADTRLENFSKSYWYGSDLSSLDTPTKLFLAILASIEVSLSRIMLTGSVGFNMCMFCCMCHHFNVKYTYFNENVEDHLWNRNGKGEMTVDDLKESRENLGLLSRAVGTMDTLFCKSAFM